jgi:hypothetical protein
MCAEPQRLWQLSIEESWSSPSSASVYLCEKCSNNPRLSWGTMAPGWKQSICPGQNLAGKIRICKRYFLKHFPQYCELSSNSSVQLSLAESCVNLCALGLHLCGKCSKAQECSFEILNPACALIMTADKQTRLSFAERMNCQEREFWV